MTPRKHLDLNRGRIAALKARSRGDSALQAALAAIGATFGDAAVINGLKLRVEDMIKRGPCDQITRARYSGVANMLQNRDCGNIDSSIAVVESFYRYHRKSPKIASFIDSQRRWPLEVLRELRLILRLIRRYRHRTGYDQLPGILSFIISESIFTSHILPYRTR
jgi:hypothetical protein